MRGNDVPLGFPEIIKLLNNAKKQINGIIPPLRDKTINKGGIFLKKIILLLAAIILFVFACEQDMEESENRSVEVSATERESVPEFSYGEAVRSYSENSAGVRFKGFKNTDKVITDSVEKAIARAKNECRENYDSVSVYYDETGGMWNVCFYNKGKAHNSFDVYLTDTGITTLIVTSQK